MRKVYWLANINRTNSQIPVPRKQNNEFTICQELIKSTLAAAHAYFFVGVRHKKELG